MKIGLYNYGTRGDIQPFIALAIALKKKNYDVKMVYVTPYQSDYSAYEKEFGIEIEAAVNQDFYSNNKINLNNLEDAAGSAMYFDHLAYCAHLAMNKLCQQVDLVITSSGSYEMHGYAEKYNRPYITVSLQYHLIPSVSRKVKYAENNDRSIEESWRDVELHFAPEMQKKVNIFRSHIGLPPLINAYRETAYSNELALVGISEIFCGEIKEGWKDNFKVCGYFSPPAISDENNFSEPLNIFLSAKDEPLFFSMGSQSHFESQSRKIYEHIIQAARMLAKRLVIQNMSKENFSDLFLGDENIYVINGAIDHRSIMQKCAVIIHHGGTGTTHAACFSGKPSLVLHYWGDMPEWAEDLKRIGVAQDTIYAPDATPEWIAEQLTKILNDKNMLKKAAQIGDIIRNENFSENAIRHIEEYLKKSQ